MLTTVASPTVSIAMAAYNGARFIEAQLASIASQTRLPDELIVCDDRSTDETVAILEAFAAEASFPVRIHRNEVNLGYVGNFEKALSLCQEDIIFLSDQDDVWFPNKIERVLSAFDENPGAIVVMNDQMIADSELVPTGVTKLTNIQRHGMPTYQFVTGCCSAHRRDWLAIVLPIPAIGCSHDKWINEIAHRLDAVHLLPLPLQLYRRHGENVSNSRISSPERPGRLHGLIGRLSGLSSRSQKSIGAPTPEWSGAIIARLKDRQAELARLNLAEAAQNLISNFEAQSRVRRQRQHIWSRPRLRRPPLIAELWRSNGYRQFSGWRSAVRDFIHPRVRDEAITR